MAYRDICKYQRIWECGAGRAYFKEKTTERPRLNLTVEVNDLAFHQERFVNFELGTGVQMSYLYERFFNMQIVLPASRRLSFLSITLSRSLPHRVCCIGTRVITLLPFLTGVSLHTLRSFHRLPLPSNPLHPRTFPRATRRFPRFRIIRRGIRCPIGHVTMQLAVRSCSAGCLPIFLAALQRVPAEHAVQRQRQRRNAAVVEHKGTITGQSGPVRPAPYGR